MNRQMTVSQLARYLKGVFEDEELLHDVTLTGEVIDLSYSDRHTYLVLGDGMFSVKCVHFCSRDKIEKGEKVALVGSVGFYDKRSSVSFVYTEFFVQGAGDKSVKLEQIKKRLFEKGYFENRPQLPRYITSVVAVTSPDGAAIRDFIRVVHEKTPFVNIRVFPVKVQGEGAAAQMTRAINKLQTVPADAIVLCRGGGSDEDLDSFNDEALATAVACSTVPVISAVGHEINYSLCDYCAGTRAGTPSIAGNIVSAHALSVTQDLAQNMLLISEAVTKKAKQASVMLNRFGKIVMREVSDKLHECKAEVCSADGRAINATRARLVKFKSELSELSGRVRGGVMQKYIGASSTFDKYSSLLQALDPHRVIKIGYAAVLKKGEKVSSAGELSAGDSVSMVFADGEATAVIQKISVNEE